MKKALERQVPVSLPHAQRQASFLAGYLLYHGRQRRFPATRELKLRISRHSFLQPKNLEAIYIFLFILSDKSRSCQYAAKNISASRLVFMWSTERQKRCPAPGIFQVRPCAGFR
jgi:hypothetical protein